MKKFKRIFRPNDGSSSSSSDTSEGGPILVPGFYGQFPAIFSISFAWRDDDTKSLIFFIYDETNRQGEKGQQGTKLYAFSIKTRRRHQTLTLYTGANPDSDSPLAFAAKEKAFHSTTAISLPAHATGPLNQVERLENNSSLKSLSERFSFSVAVGLSPSAGSSANQQTEQFEWRGERAKPTRPMQPQNDSPDERRLVRLSSNALGRAEEVVGVWTDEPPTPFRGNKLGTFEFLGAGRSGELGPAWTLMAVMTLLRILEIELGDGEAWARMTGLAGGMGIFGPGLI